MLLKFLATLLLSVKQKNVAKDHMCSSDHFSIIGPTTSPWITKWLVVPINLIPTSSAYQENQSP